MQRVLVRASLIVMIAIALSTAALSFPRIGAGQPRAQEPQAQDGTFRLQRDGLKLELAALAPDQIRAFFLGRGFNKSDTEVIVATACLYRSSIGSNHAKVDAPQVTVALADWRVTPSGGTTAAPKMREDWERLWAQRGTNEEAKVAFYWALFPSRQSFAAGDYNWGMLTFGLPPGTKFSLDLKWRNGGALHKARLENLQCGN